MNNRIQKALTANEKNLVISVYNYLKNNKQYIKFPHSFNLRAEVSKATGISESTIGNILAKKNKNIEIVDSKQGHRPSKEIQPEIRNKLRELIYDANKNGKLLTLKIL
ncbi:14760_t:CDS:1, partial [Dentiscutata erythropus]